MRRLKLFYSILFLLFAIILLRLWYLQILEGPALAAQSETVRTRLLPRIAPRGAILDDKGRVLATSRPRFVIAVLPDALQKNPAVLSRLAGLLQMTPAALAALLARNRTAGFDPVPIERDIDMRLLTQIEEQKLDLPGVVVLSDSVRAYPEKALFAHALGVARPIPPGKLESLRRKGYHSGDSVGVEGLEAAYESDLHGQDGGQRIAVDARGRMTRGLEELPPVAGHTLRLSLDRELQQAAYAALQEPLAQGHPGAVVALDPNDGAVLAFVSTPSYDPNRYGADYARLLQDPLKPLINRASASFTPCGSTFKLVTAAAGLETGAITPETQDDCPGFIRMGSRVFHCDKRDGHGRIGFTRALGASCDVYFWHVGEKVGEGSLADWAQRFGLGAKTGIDLPAGEDAKGIVPSPEWKRQHHLGPWVPGDLLNMAIGQGYVGVTPLQLACYTAAIANGGTLYRPQIVREVSEESGGRSVGLRRMQPEARGTLGLSPANRDAIVEGMLQAMQPGGTAYGSAIPGLAVAGKTGTAEVRIHGRPASNSLFVCFAPADHPRIALAVVVEGGGHGADTAAPIARRILGQFFGLHLATTVPIGPRHNVD
ncbi:MAG TPA: penicillin-binding protein 2 [Chthonomonadaceae bacterium]|nr:penicillin-binding protein 2 [Chthonomonadaceae bacterium]